MAKKEVVDFINGYKKQRKKRTVRYKVKNNNTTNNNNTIATYNLLNQNNTSYNEGTNHNNDNDNSMMVNDELSEYTCEKSQAIDDLDHYQFAGDNNQMLEEVLNMPKGLIEFGKDVPDCQSQQQQQLSNSCFFLETKNLLLSSIDSVFNQQLHQKEKQDQNES